MQFEHVIPPEVNYYPMYSVEYLDNNDQWNCWTQHGCTHLKWQAYVLAFEVWLRYRKTHKRRVRVL